MGRETLAQETALPGDCVPGVRKPLSSVGKRIVAIPAETQARPAAGEFTFGGGIERRDLTWQGAQFTHVDSAS